jgi:hypothetical protein
LSVYGCSDDEDGDSPGNNSGGRAGAAGNRNGTGGVSFGGQAGIGTSGQPGRSGSSGNPTGGSAGNAGVPTSKATAPSSYNGPTPELAFQLGSGDGRKLIFANNPEQLLESDMRFQKNGDGTNDPERFYVEPLRLNGLLPGKYRYFFEFLNRTGRSLKVGVQFVALAQPIENNGVKVNGAGFTTGILGGKPFADMFNSYDANPPTTTFPQSGAVKWLLGDGGPKGAGDSSTVVDDNQFFSGVVDFEFSFADNPNAKNVLKLMAYEKQASTQGNNEAIRDYVVRKEADGTRESRVYKGVSEHSEAVATALDYEFDDDDTLGYLPVTYRRYNFGTGTFGDPQPSNDGWVSNIGGPENQAKAVMSDMATFQFTPVKNGAVCGEISKVAGVSDPFFTFSPFQRQTFPAQPSDCDANGWSVAAEYPNFGNWGILYQISGSLKNTGSRPRVVSVNLAVTSTSSGTSIAYRNNQNTWGEQRLEAQQSFMYRTIEVAPGATVAYKSEYVVGGPAVGNLRHFLALED